MTVALTATPSTTRITAPRVAAVAALTHLLVATRYGWHRDEFYYVTAGRHLAWGYVDQPPIVPLIARIAAAFPGGVLPLRIVAVAAQVGCILLAAALARELGGSARARTLAAAATAACPIFVGSSLLLGTTVMDQLAWAAAMVLVARALRRASTSAWVAVGVAAGLGLETKHTVVVLLLGVALGLLVTRRSVFTTRGPWLAGAIAAAVWMPNLIWDATHGWATLDMASVLSSKQGGPLGALGQLPLLLLVLAGPALVILWVAGVRWLLGTRQHQWLLVVAATTAVVFTASGGRIYYSAPALIGLFAAGAVATSDRRWTMPIVVEWVAASLLALPFLPPTAASAMIDFSPAMIETYGWPAFSANIARLASTLPTGTPVFTSNYGEAGALAYYQPSLAVYSGHNAYRDWGAPKGSPAVVLLVGEWPARYLHQFWNDVKEIGPVVMPHHVKDEETKYHAVIFICRSPLGTWAQMWPRLRHLD